jgi:uncharacterized membrane protein YeaQ/YmgE (transglycosylase-associated protein family)
MYFLAWIFIGGVVGWAAGSVLEGRGYGSFMDVVMGVAGAVASGSLMRTAGFGGLGGTIVTTLFAVIGAALLTIIVGYGRRIYARQRGAQI